MEVGVAGSIENQSVRDHEVEDPGMKDAEKHGVVDLDDPEKYLPADEVEDMNVEKHSNNDVDVPEKDRQFWGNSSSRG